ncbi:cdc42 effector protein 2-like [Denticeps clupeoides]|uniref:CRIB domain-containing protein n=1 Tax=Denticeps clupeoides TaxID=299321 RepID=A0AAY4CEA4_9TELE|nr:cdc42 effector protein 2-like [Denticeps clupeoides]
MPLKSSLHFKSATLRSSRKPRPGTGLSVGMISQPLGDFRHLSHIGLDSHGDAFGDLSLFQKGGSAVLHGSCSDQNLYLMASPPPKPPRLLSPEEITPGTQASANSRPKKSHSLPMLDDVEMEEGACPAARSQLPKHQYSDYAVDELPLVLNLDLGPSILEEVLKVMENK